MPEMPTNRDAGSWAGADATVVPGKATVQEFFQN
jgi:hypothetical protein